MSIYRNIQAGHRIAIDMAVLIDNILIFGAILGIVSSPFYVATTLNYRQRDNGLAFILFVLGMGVWNGMFIAQLFGQNILIKEFFLSLSIVGALLAGIGWFLFAGTASSTPRIPAHRVVYGTAAVLIGIDIVLAVMAPVHPLYWMVAPESASKPFTVIIPRIGYWLHTALLLILFSSGTVLFGAAWRAGVSSRFTRVYCLVGTVATIGILGSNVLVPGGFSFAPAIAVGLATIGWVQAQR